MHYKKVQIKVNSIAEKIAALYHLKAVSGAEISSVVLNDALNNYTDSMAFPYIYITPYDNVITASMCQLNDKKLVYFNELNKVDDKDYEEVALDHGKYATIHNDTVKIGANCVVSHNDILKLAEKLKK